MRLAQLFAFVATTWLMLLLTAPGADLGVPVSGAVYAFGSLICHQQPGRSFYVGAAQLPVCARCFGLYLGAAVPALALIVVPRVAFARPGIAASGFRARRLSSSQLAGKITRDRLRVFLLAGAVPTAVTWLAEAAGLWVPSNMTRFLAALPLGAAVALTVNYVECAPLQRSKSRRPPTLT